MPQLECQFVGKTMVIRIPLIFINGNERQERDEMTFWGVLHTSN